MKSLTTSRFLRLIKAREKEKAAQSRYNTACSYRATYNSFSEFISEKQYLRNKVNETIIMEYSIWLKGRGLLKNTISFYMRVLRATWNANKIPGNPFMNVFTGYEVTQKRSLEEDTVAKIGQTDFASDKALDFTKDLFLFSIGTCGMSFVDIANLQKTDCKDGYINYVRSKTGQSLRVKVEDGILSIISKWKAEESSPYLFPILTHLKGSEEAFREYTSALRSFNLNLKKLGSEVGCTTLSSYYARHTWATTAQNCLVPTSVISSCLGHSNENITRVYLAGLKGEVMADANKRVLQRLRLNR